MLALLPLVLLAATPPPPSPGAWHLVASTPFDAKQVTF